MKLDLIQQMKRNKKPFTLTISGSKIIVENSLGKFIYMDLSNRLLPSELGLLNSVKHYVLKNVDYKNIYVPEKIKYIDFGYFHGFEDNVIEFDLNMAFWEIAKQKEFINDVIYEKGINCSKRGRLVAIGATAKTTSKWIFDGNRYIFQKPKDILPTNKVFYCCCYETSIIMNEIRSAIGEDYCFYWIDAIFIRPSKKAIKACIEIADKFKITGKFKYINLIYADSHTINVYDNCGIGNFKNIDGELIWTHENERIFTKARNIL